jgi:hypothetical protein
MARGGMMKEFQEVCFEVQPSTLNQPIWIEVKTEFGYQCVSSYFIPFLSLPSISPPTERSLKQYRHDRGPSVGG